MAINMSRSMNADLKQGAVDGKYAAERPNTSTDAMNAVGDRLVAANRQALNPLDGFLQRPYPTPVSPAGF